MKLPEGSQCNMHIILYTDKLHLKHLVSYVQVVPYTFVRRGVPVTEGTYAEPSACEVG